MSTCLPAISIPAVSSPAVCVPSVVFSETLSDQTSTFGFSTVFTTSSSGVYRISIGLFVAGSGGVAGTVEGQYLWGDHSFNNGASFGGSSLYPGNQVYTFRVPSGLALQWEVTSLSSVDHYDLSIVIEQLAD